ncbi:MAG: hypothetical protein RL303_401 [Verrucomicrobiota bacterium]
MIMQDRRHLDLRPTLALATFALTSLAPGLRAEPVPKFDDPTPQAYHLRARASEVDPAAKAYPEIEFPLESKGKPADVETADVDTRVAPRGQLVVWLMGHNPLIAEKVNGYGYHHISVHYARGWFSKLNTVPADRQHLGNIRLEATAGVDASQSVAIAEADSAKGRATRLVRWLAKKHPQGRWEQFLVDGGKALDWTKVVVGGSSHGATSAARFAMHQKVARVVMFCGARDNTEDWQAGPSATPLNRFFGYSHVLDSGWTGHHYQRSWLMLRLNAYGPVVNVDTAKPPYGGSRRLITAAPMKGDDKKQAAAAHSFVTPGKASPKDAQGRFLQEDVWTYLFTSDVDATGKPVPAEAGIRMRQHPDDKAETK